MAGLAPIGVNLSTAVILSEAKDRRSAQPEILRFAQDDRLKFTPMGLAPAMFAPLRSMQKNETYPCPKVQLTETFLPTILIDVSD